MNLKGKVAIVTGARRGIGEAIAVALAEAGADVVVSDIDKADCGKVVGEIEKTGAKALAVKVDVSSSADVDAMVSQTVQKFGKVDIMVSNAGIYIAKPVAEFSEAEWDKIIDINLKGFFLCAKAAAAQMTRQKKGGKIISISSIAGKVGVLNSAAYCASKGGIIAMTKALALELAPYRINVNSIAPGAIETPMSAAALRDEKTRKATEAEIPWGRIGKPQEIASAVVFLASREADYITGATLVVDGGWLSH